MGRKKKYVRVLSAEEVSLVSSIIEETSTSDTIRNRCRILLVLCSPMAEGTKTYMECASEVGVSYATVVTTVRSFNMGGVASAITIRRNPNSNVANLKATPAVESTVVSLARKEGDWSLRSLATESSKMAGVHIGKDTVAKILRKNGITL